MEIFIEILFNTLMSGALPNWKSYCAVVALLVASFFGYAHYQSTSINTKQQARLELIQYNAHAKGFKYTLDVLSKSDLDGNVTKGEYAQIKKAYKYNNKIFKRTQKYAGQPIELT